MPFLHCVLCEMLGMDINMSGIKICGIRRMEDVIALNKYMPDYAGFMFAKSRRQVTVEDAALLISRLDKKIKTVGVFVNEELEVVIKTAQNCKLDVVQLHGDETPEYIADLKAKFQLSDLCGNNKIEVWKAIRVKDFDSIKELTQYSADAYLLDAFVEGSYGGTGKTFNWDVAVEAVKYGRIVLSGGLDTDNVSDAIERVSPLAVDLSSGVETKGWKDEGKIKEFINKVRERR